MNVDGFTAYISGMLEQAHKGFMAYAGTAAIQVAKQIGTKIFTTAGSQEKLDFAKELGANVLINYKEQDFSEIVKKKTQGAELKVMHRPAGWPIKYMHASKKHIHAKLGCFGQRLVIAPSVLAGLNPTCLQSLML